VAEKFMKMSSIHEIRLDLPAELPRPKADRVRVERVLGNLIDNAIKYSPEGGDIAIAVRPGDEQLIVSVKDQGIGISPKEQSKLFRRFQRLDAFDRHGIQGVGLGLNVCRLLVAITTDLGDIRTGKGLTFFSLPIVRDSESRL
jgi:signal transduction histidine kinase